MFNQRLKVNSYRQYRLIKALYERREISVKDLRNIVGALNVAEVRSQLRKLGWSDSDIITERRHFVDRDGLHCMPGYYRLTEKGRKAAKAAIERWEAATSRLSK